MSLSQLSVTNAITALGALGTASFGLVDATKAAGGGISRVGVSNIKEALLPLFGPNPSPNDRSTPLTYASVLDNLRANWMNGTDLAPRRPSLRRLSNCASAPQQPPSWPPPRASIPLS